MLTVLFDLFINVLGTFVADFLKEGWRRLRHPASASRWNKEDEEAYLRAIQAALSRRTYFAGSSSRRLTVDVPGSQDPDIYVELSAIDLSARAVRVVANDREVLGRKQNILSFILREQNVLIIGDPGAGKTMTALKYVDLVAKRSLRNSTLLLRAIVKIPVFVDLGLIGEMDERELDEDQAHDWLLHEIREQLRKDTILRSYAEFLFDPQRSTTLRDYFNAGRLVMVLDAFNEVPPNRYELLWDRIKKVAVLTRKFHNSIVITGREKQHNESGRYWGEGNEELLLRISELSDPEIKRLIKKLVEGFAVADHYGKDFIADVLGYQDDTVQLSASQSKTIINPRLARNIRNPLYLTLFFYNYCKYPHKRSYTSIADLFTNWFQTAIINLPNHRKARLIEYLEVLAYGILNSMAQGVEATNISPSTAAAILSSFSTAEQKELGEEAQRCGILAPQQGAIGVRFNHQRFLEFFAARRWFYLHWTLNQTNLDELLQLLAPFYDHPKRHWDEVMIMAASLFDDPTGPLRTIYAAPKTLSAHLYSNYDHRAQLGAYFLEATRDDFAPDVRAAVHNFTSIAITRLTGQLRSGVPVPDQLVYVEALGAIPGAAALEALKETSKDEARSVLVRQEAVRQLAVKFWDKQAQNYFRECLVDVDSELFWQSLPGPVAERTRPLQQQRQRSRVYRKALQIGTGIAIAILVISTALLLIYLWNNWGWLRDAVVFVILGIITIIYIGFLLYMGGLIIYGGFLLIRALGSAMLTRLRRPSSPVPQPTVRSQNDKEATLPVPTAASIIDPPTDDQADDATTAPDPVSGALQMSPAVLAAVNSIEVSQSLPAPEQPSAPAALPRPAPVLYAAAPAPAPVVPQRSAPARQIMREVAAELWELFLNAQFSVMGYVLLILIGIALFRLQDPLFIIYLPGYHLAVTPESAYSVQERLISLALENPLQPDIAYVLFFGSPIFAEANPFSLLERNWIVAAVMILLYITTIASAITSVIIGDRGIRLLLRVGNTYVARRKQLIWEDEDTQWLQQIKRAVVVSAGLMAIALLCLPFALYGSFYIFWLHGEQLRDIFARGLWQFFLRDQRTQWAIGLLVIPYLIGLMSYLTSWLIVRKKYNQQIGRLREVGEKVLTDGRDLDTLLDIINDADKPADYRLEAARYVRKLVKERYWLMKELDGKNLILRRLSSFQNEYHLRKEPLELASVVVNTIRDLKHSMNFT
ncbi:NACHT domain-containing protein [Candidatus Chloroploca asiatica]|uniref:NACHT domain-containing protein n=1 Tax=Candidatus Chloroploca asiatica TaxID=1506545 RepID=A0A2H3KMN7_9CHLR|nr:hypothetical protein [Candidatus Chloroploca asiatica]PDV99364.1 hypothetical protein A9Q02_22215 [Candidatus Chloroploca asiatica]